MRWAVPLLVVTVGFGAAGCVSPADGARIERLEAVATVLVDGSIEIAERLTVDFGNHPRTSYRRTAPSWRHDGVFGIDARMDNRTFPPGEGPARITIGGPTSLDVTWHFAAASGVHEYFLAYRVAGAVEVSGLRGVIGLRWLEAHEHQAIGDAVIMVHLPNGAVPLEDPWIEEAGWTVAATPTGLTASRRGVASDQSATVGLAFTVDTMAVAEPAWQYHAKRSRDLMPAFVSAGVFLVVVAAGVLGMLRLKYPTWRLRGEPPDVQFATTPALDFALLRGRPRADQREVEAARDDLARRGLSSPRDALLGHERLVLEEAWFRRNASGGRAAVSRAFRRRFRRALLADLVVTGLADGERVAVMRDLRMAAIMTVAVGVAAWAATWATLRQLGPWPYAIPAGLLVSGIMLAVASQRQSILSQNGMIVRARVLYSARVRDGRASA